MIHVIRERSTAQQNPALDILDSDLRARVAEVVRRLLEDA
jgi:hypothetical protein